MWPSASRQTPLASYQDLRWSRSLDLSTGFMSLADTVLLQNCIALTMRLTGKTNKMLQMFKCISKYSSSKYLDSELTGPRARVSCACWMFQKTLQDQQIYNNLKYHSCGGRKQFLRYCSRKSTGNLHPEPSSVMSMRATPSRMFNIFLHRTPPDHDLGPLRGCHLNKDGNRD